jgi:hypothetical protein
MLNQAMPYVFLGNAVLIYSVIDNILGFQEVAMLWHLLFRVTALIVTVSVFQPAGCPLITG